MQSKGQLVITDRLGSVRANLSTGEHFKYFPYGEENASPTTANDREKFATYTRDSSSGLDYADQRYYASTWGRFLVPDPSPASNANTLTQNWNKYAYVGGDPANKTDPTGFCSPEDDPPCFDVTVYGYPIPVGGCGPTEYFAPFSDWCVPAIVLPYVILGPGAFNRNNTSNQDDPQCYIEADTQPAGPSLGGLNPFKHSSLYVSHRSGVTHRIEAGPSGGFGSALAGTGTLVPRITDGIAYGAPGLYSTPYSSWWTNAFRPSSLLDTWCNIVDRLLAWARSFPGGVPYNALLGPNSNSFTYTISTASGLALPAPPSISPGWGQFIPQF